MQNCITANTYAPLSNNRKFGMEFQNISGYVEAI